MSDDENNRLYCNDCEEAFAEGDKLYWIHCGDTVMKPVCIICVDKYRK